MVDTQIDCGAASALTEIAAFALAEADQKKSISKRFVIFCSDPSLEIHIRCVDLRLCPFLLTLSPSLCHPLSSLFLWRCHLFHISMEALPLTKRIDCLSRIRGTSLQSRSLTSPLSNRQTQALLTSPGEDRADPYSFYQRHISRMVVARSR